LNIDNSSNLIRLLIKEGAKIDAVNGKGQTPIMLLFIQKNEDEIIGLKTKYDPISALKVFIEAKA
jgi:ankyrin repeat protein